MAAGIGALLIPVLEVCASTNNVPAAPLPGADIGSSIIRLVGALGLVLALFFAGVWLSKNWQRFAQRQNRASDLRVVEVRSLGPRQAVWVVGFRQQRFLLSSSAAGINLLAELPAADPAEEAPAPAPASLDFAEAFRRVLQRGNS